MALNGHIYGQVDILRSSISTHTQQVPLDSSHMTLSFKASSRKAFTCHRRSAKELRKSNQYDGTALSLRLADTQCSFGRYATDCSWCMGRTDASSLLTPSDRVARYYSPTARALTMKQARAITIAFGVNPSNNDSCFKAANTETWEPRRLVTAPAAWSACNSHFGYNTSHEQSKKESEEFSQPKNGTSMFTMDPSYCDRWAHALDDLNLADLDRRITSSVLPIDDKMNKMICEIKWKYKKAVARSSVEYELLELNHTLRIKQEICMSNNVNVFDPSILVPRGSKLPVEECQTDAWSDMEFRLSSWRVLRQTGVSRERLRFAYTQLEDKLYVIEQVQADLQCLWSIGAHYSQYPLHVEKNKANIGNSDVSAYVRDRDHDIKVHCPNIVTSMRASEKLAAFTFSRGGNEFVATPLSKPYCEILLTDVGSSEFCRRLPMSLDIFSAHIATRAASTVDLLRSQWLSEASRLLNDSLGCMRIQEKQEGSGNLKQGLDKLGYTRSNASDKNPVTLHDKNIVRELKLHRTKLECLPVSLSYSSKRKDCCNNLGANNSFINGSPGMSSMAQHVTSRNSTLRLNRDAAAVLMSRQLRVLCESSLQTFSSFFKSFDLTTSSRMSVFLLNLHLNKIPSHKKEPNNPVDIVRLEPSLVELLNQANSAIECLVASASGVPQPYVAKILHGISNAQRLTLRTCGVALDDELVAQTRRHVRAALTHHFKGPLKIVARFAAFHSLLDGTVDTEVRTEVLARAQGGGDTTVSLEGLARLCSRLAELGSSVRTATADVVHEPLFSVACNDCKTQLGCITDSLRYLVAESVASDNHKHMISICQEYSEVVERLQEEPIDCTELRALQEYSTRCIDTLTRLMDEYSGQVHERVHFLLTQTQRDCSRASLSRDDAALLVTTCQWPAAVRQSMAHSHDVQQTRKRHLEMLVEGQQEALSREATNLEKKIEKIAEAGSLAPSEVQAIYKRIVGVQESLAAMRIDAVDIERQEKLLQLALTDNQTRLSIVEKALAPLAQLWAVVKEWVEKINHWQHDPLSTIDAQDAECSTVELRAALGAAVRELEESGDARITPTRAGKLLQQEVKIFDEEQLPLLRLVCQPGMKDRHWAQIKKSTRLESLEITETSNLLQMLDVGLQHYAGVIEETCVAAGHEHALEEQLGRMEHAWTAVTFAAETWRGFYKLCGTEEVQQELDDQILRTQTIQGNKYIRPHAKHAATWEAKLTKLQETIDNLLRLEAAWLYLEPIFKAGDDVVHQMPTEAKLFGDMDAAWRTAILAILNEPAVLTISERPGILTSLIGANAKLELVRKGLTGYLDAKRLVFPRFYFISDAELLEILADTVDPTCVQPHLYKCFDGIAGLVFLRNADGGLEVVAALDVNPNLKTETTHPLGDSLPTASAHERLNFAYDYLNIKPIRPSTSSCDIERWLGEVEIIARKSLAFVIEDSIKAQFSISSCGAIALRVSRAHAWQEQVILVVHQVSWTRDVEDALRRAAVAAAEVEEARLLDSRRVSNSNTQQFETPLDPHAAIRSLFATKQCQLEETISVIRRSADAAHVTSRARSSLSVLIIMDIYQRDVICALVEGRVCDVSDFEWVVQLRYYLRNDSMPYHHNESNKVETRCVHDSLPYTYEYLGGGGRGKLILTPMTSRCFRAIFCALRTHVGCALRGVSGAGLTSTIRGLARSLATHMVTLNCSCLLGCVTMGVLLRGAAACRTWMCLEQFSRLRLEIMSAAVAQISESFSAAQLSEFTSTNKIARAFLTDADWGKHHVESASGVSEIFRPISLSFPDATNIAEVFLCSRGATRIEACKLARHITKALQLCAESFSGREPHYQFSLRLVSIVTRNVASVIQRHGGFGIGGIFESNVTQLHGIETCAVAARVLTDIIEPGLPVQNMEHIKQILSSVFPGAAMVERDSSEDLVIAFRETCSNRKEQPLESFYNKVVQLHDIILSWPGAALIGRPFSGKTSTWKNLSATLDQLYSGQSNMSWCGVTSMAVHTGSLSLSELYGNFDSAKREWADGILSNCYRKISQREASGAMQTKRVFLVLDGIVDTSWSEHLHTALDESSVLCLSNGELLRHSSCLSIIFESENLKNAAPTTVGRISVVNFGGNNYMTWQVLFDTWIANRDIHSYVEPTTLPGGFQKSSSVSNKDAKGPYQNNEVNNKNAFHLSEEECRLLEALSEWLLEPSLAFVRHELCCIVEPMTDESLVQSLLRLLDGMLYNCLRGAAPGGSSDVKERRQRRQHIECAFLWALLWSVGASGPDVSQMRFGVFLREFIADGRVIRTRYPLVHESLLRRGWCVPEFTGVFSGTLQLALPAKGSAHDYEYHPRDNETGSWRMWQDTLQAGQIPQPEIGGSMVFSEVLIPTVQTVQSGLLLDLLMRAGGQPALFCGPPGSGKTAHARAALARLPRKKHRTAYLRLHATTSSQSFCRALLSHLVKRRKGVYGPPINQRAVVFVDDINLPDANGLGRTQMPVELLRGLIETGSWYEILEGRYDSKPTLEDQKQCPGEMKEEQSSQDTGFVGTPKLQRAEDTSVWAATNGRVASGIINSRLMRHFTLVHTSDPSDATLTRVFTVLVESHFASQSFASEVVATTAALVSATLWTLREVISELRPTPSRNLCTFDARDSARCLQGVLRCRADDDFDRAGLARLWIHEILRTFCDRLSTSDDQDWFATHLQTAVLRNFKLDIDSLLSEVAEVPQKDGRPPLRCTSLSASLNATGRSSVRSPTNGSIGARELQHLIFGDFHNPLERGVYLEARDAIQLYDALERVRDELHGQNLEYENENDKSLSGIVNNSAQETAKNACSSKHMVLFPLVVAHVSRLIRVLNSARGGHALLTGVTGTGRRAVVRLAVHVAGCELREPQPYSQFDSFASWRRELKSASKYAGVLGETPICLLIADTHILSLEVMLADICDVVSTGHTPGLFVNDERAEIAEETRTRVRRQRGTKNADTMGHDDLFSFFLERVRTRLHIALVISHSQDSVIQRQAAAIICRFPTLISHFMCVDHYATWQDDSLTAVAENFLSSATFSVSSGLELDRPQKLGNEMVSNVAKDVLPIMSGVRPDSTAEYAGRRLQAAAVALCCQIHNWVARCLDPRMRGTTSTFLELLESLRVNLVQARVTIAKTRTTYGRALDVAHHAQRAIATIGDGIAAARAALDATSFETVVFDTELSHKKSVSGVESKYAEVEADAEALLHEEAAARVLAEEFERDIAQAQPAFDDAYSSLETLGIDELSELRSLPRPPIGAKPILEAVCILLGEKPVKVADPVDPTRRVLDFWGAAQQRVLIGEPAQLAKRLRAVDHDKIAGKAITKLKDTYIGPGATHEASFLDPEILDGFAGAGIARALCRWVRAASSYEHISRTAQPKRDAASHARSELEKSLEALQRKRNELSGVEDELADIAARRDATRGRCDELQETVLKNSRRLERAKCLLDALISGGELEGWQAVAHEAEMRANSFLADAILSAGALTYLAPLDSYARHACLVEWAKSCRRCDLTVSMEWGGSQQGGDSPRDTPVQVSQPALVKCSANQIISLLKKIFNSWPPRFLPLCSMNSLCASGGMFCLP